MSPQLVNWSVGHCSGRRNLRQQSAVRPPEAELSIGLSFHLVALFVDRAMVPATEHHEIRQCRRASMRPVPDVMSLTERPATAREAAAVIAMLKRAPECRRDRACPRADLRHPAIGVVPHEHPAGVARQTLGRFL